MRQRARAVLVAVLAFLITCLSLPAMAATPVHEITARWIDPPSTISRGNPVVAEWRVNLNDGDNPPANDPTDNGTATFTVTNALFTTIPDLCLTAGVDPVSAISEDGRELTCNFGTVPMGTAIVVQTPVLADGVTGDEVSASGEIGEVSADLPPIVIENPFVMDMYWGANTRQQRWNTDADAIDFNLQWTLRLGVGSDPGPDRVEYVLRVSTIDNSPVSIGTDADGGIGCTPFPNGNAPGHPWSNDELADTNPRNTRFVDSCSLTQEAPGVFRLVLEGIDYSLLNLPTRDSSNAPLPTDWNAVAAGSVWFQVATESAGSLQLEMDPVTYTSPFGATTPDLIDNNVSNKAYTRPGTWAGSWERTDNQAGGNYWDDTYRLTPGSTAIQRAGNRFFSDSPTDVTSPNYGNCLALDTRYLTFSPETVDDPSGVATVLYTLDGTYPTVPTASVGVVEYYTGTSPLLDPAGTGYAPDQFSCAGTAGWTSALPADETTVRALRITYPFSRFAELESERIDLRVSTMINTDVQVGQDVWMFASVLRDGTWNGPGVGQPITTTPDARYPNTTLRRDILRVIGAQPVIQKSAETAVVTPGVPTEFVLTYAATGAGAMPDTVDDYTITDVLPLGMTYVDGSADPAPAVSIDPQGRQVLTWQLDGVATNTDLELAYQAVADASVEPGSVLTNTATSSYAGRDSTPATASVTTSNNGFTAILKTADQEYIPNDAGDGVGSGSWTVTIESSDPRSQDFTDTIDILPYNGDGRGTSFHGSYSLDEVTLLDGGTVYYTDADPDTLNDDPADPSNGAAGNPDGNTVGWTTERPENVTAIRVIGGELLSGESFSYRLMITTDGAEPEDVYVNRAQARASHTELVMRTSAALVVTSYLVEKTSDPESGSDVQPGQTITYTVTVTQQGSVPAGAWFTDDLEAVLDDATYNDDVEASSGEVGYADGVLSWAGELPVGGSATITYSVTVKDPEALRAEGDTALRNLVSSPGCAGACETTHQVGLFEFSKTSVAAPGSVVRPDEVITYTVTVSQTGEGAVADASVVDDLTAVLDDAGYNGDVAASDGEVAVDGTTLTWQGDLAVGQQVTITYSVTVGAAGEGDDELANVVTTPDERGRCVPAADQNPDCRTVHELGDFTYAKTSVAAPGSEVAEGDTVTYTVTVTHIGTAPVAGAVLVDDLSGVLSNAEWNDDAEASAGTLTRDGTSLRWTGDLAAGDVVTITYSVTVGEHGTDLRNVVTSADDRGTCVPAADGNEGCATEHHLPPPPEPPAPPAPPAPPLAETGAPIAAGMIPAGLALVVLGAMLLVARFGRRSKLD